MVTTVRQRLPLLILTLACMLIPASAPAWEAESTHAGLSERAALHARLHGHLRDHLGMDAGLFAELAIPPQDAPALFQALSALNPTHGYVPDTRGQMRALAWLSVGSVLADIPVAHAGHHFFDPTTEKGLSDSNRGGAFTRSRQWLQARSVGASVVTNGRPAPEWALDADNPMSLAGFIDQYAKSVSARTTGERSRHLAGAMLAAGALLHLLQDMGSPSHVRDDIAAHYDKIGTDSLDVGSRFERVAALVYGRLGVPAPADSAGTMNQTLTAVAETGLKGFFSNEGGTGLADRTASRWFSAHTLPAPIKVHAGMSSSAIQNALNAGLARPEPMLPTRPGWLDLEMAKDDRGRLVDSTGVCLAEYRLSESGSLSWMLDDACVNEQISAILPEVAAYSTALLDWLFRGAIEFSVGNGDGRGIAVKFIGSSIGAGGTLTFYAEDAEGNRTPLGTPFKPEAATIDNDFTTQLIPPAGTKAIAAIFRGVDGAGQPLVAVGFQNLSSQ